MCCDGIIDEFIISYMQIQVLQKRSWLHNNTLQQQNMHCEDEMMCCGDTIDELIIYYRQIQVFRNRSWLHDNTFRQTIKQSINSVEQRSTTAEQWSTTVEQFETMCCDDTIDERLIYYKQIQVNQNCSWLHNNTYWMKQSINSPEQWSNSKQCVVMTPLTNL